MDPATLSMLGMMGSGALSGLFSPSAQQRESFEGTDADPADWLGGARNAISNVFQGATRRANEGIDLSGLTPSSSPSAGGYTIPRRVGSASNISQPGMGLDPNSYRSRDDIRRPGRNPNFPGNMDPTDPATWNLPPAPVGPQRRNTAQPQNAINSVGGPTQGQGAAQLLLDLFKPPNQNQQPRAA